MKSFCGFVLASPGLFCRSEGLQILADDPADNGLHYSQVIDADPDGSSHGEVGLGAPSPEEYIALLRKIVSGTSRNDHLANEFRIFLKRPGVNVNRPVPRTYGYSADQDLTFTRAVVTYTPPVLKMEILKILVIEFGANFDEEVEGKDPLFTAFIKTSIAFFHASPFELLMDHASPFELLMDHYIQPTPSRYVNTDLVRSELDERLADTLSCLLRHGVVPRFPPSSFPGQTFEESGPKKLLTHVTQAHFYKTLKVLVGCPEITPGLLMREFTAGSPCCEIMDQLADRGIVSDDFFAAWAAFLSNGHRYFASRLFQFITTDFGEDLPEYVHYREHVRLFIARQYDPLCVPQYTALPLEPCFANKNNINKLLKMLTMLILGNHAGVPDENDVRTVLIEECDLENDLQEADAMMYAFTACRTDAAQRRRAYKAKTTRLHLANTCLWRTKGLLNPGATTDVGSSERISAMWAVFCDENLMDVIFEQGHQDRCKLLMGLSPDVVSRQPETAAREQYDEDVNEQ